MELKLMLVFMCLNVMLVYMFSVCIMFYIMFFKI